MINTIKKLYGFFSPDLKRAVIIIFVLIIFAMLIETLSIGLIIPAVQLFLDANFAENYQATAKFLSYFSPLKIIQYHEISQTKNADVIIGGMLLILIVYIVKTLYLIFFNYVKEDFKLKLRYSNTKLFLDGYLKYPFIFFLNRNSAIFIRDIMSENGAILVTLDLTLVLLTEFFVLIGIITLLIFTKPLAASVILLTFSITAYTIIYFSRKKLKILGLIKMNSEAERLKYLNQILGGIKEIKVYKSEDRFVEKYLTNSKDSFLTNKWASILAALPKQILELVAIFVLVLLVMVLLVNLNTQISILATIALFTGATFRLLPSIYRIVHNYQHIQFHKAMVDHLAQEYKKIKGRQKVTSNGKINFEKNIFFKNLNFSYDNSNKKILNGINFDLQKFSKVGITGNSGVGKSTLANIIIGLINPSSGDIIIDKKRVNYPSIFWGNNLGYVPQNIFLTDNTIRNNIAFGLDEKEIDNKKIFKSVKSAQLEELIKNLPEGLNTMVGERGVRLSAGQIQRIGIARALYHDPEFILLDEATSSLDLNTEKEFMNTIHKISDKKTLLLISHRFSILDFCNVIYTLENGKLYKKEKLNNK